MSPGLQPATPERDADATNQTDRYRTPSGKDFQLASHRSKLSDDPINSTVLFSSPMCFPLTTETVVVNFYNHNDMKAPPREVWLQESDNLPVYLTYDDHGELIWSARLSHILPVAIKNDSPIKREYYL